MIAIPCSILAIENEDDRSFMEYVFKAYQKLMYYEIGKVVKDPWAKEDVLQATVLQLINKVRLLKSMGERQRTNYVAVAAKNSALTYMRNLNRRKEHSLSDYEQGVREFSDDQNPEMYLLKAEEFNLLSQVWVDLDDKNKFLLTSRYILGKSYADIAKELQIRPESARMSLSRARRAAYKLYNEKQN